VGLLHERRGGKVLIWGVTQANEPLREGATPAIALVKVNPGEQKGRPPDEGQPRKKKKKWEPGGGGS